MLTVAVDDAYFEAVGPQLRIVANYAVGVDNIDLEAGRRRSVAAREHAGRADGRDGGDGVDADARAARRLIEGDRLMRGRDPWLFCRVPPRAPPPANRL